jgi:hypothetical protein
MWGWIKDAASAVWNGVRGLGNLAWQGLWWLVNTVIGLLDGLLTLLGIMPWKKIRVQGVVLLDEKREPVADRDDVQEVLDLAKEVFAEEIKVRLSSPARHVTYVPEAAPSKVLEVGCDASIWGAQFTGVGGWFRSHQARRPSGTFFGYGSPVTVFVVRDVKGKRGCAPPGFLADYVVIDPRALAGSEGSRLTLAHEVGHACNLLHGFPSSGRGTLMQSGGDDPGVRPRRMTRAQKAVFRGSPHVTYL